ncbi:MAG TPA: hypothetical protein VEB86_13160, partial [Chryseosolibacter sp.]|nr:hypothetical protein [Chryseosolibacter sp.]
MRNFALCSSFLLIVLTCSIAHSQNVRELGAGYYVVVAAYAPAKEMSAKRYSDQLNRQGIKADYGFNSRRKYYFVYLDYFTELKASLRSMHQVRKAGRFSDAWVRVVSGDIPPQGPPIAVATQEVKVGETPVKEVSVESPADKPATDTTASPPVDEEVTENPEIVQFDTMTLGNTEVFLSLFNATNNRIVEGQVKIVDYDGKNP